MCAHDGCRRLSIERRNRRRMDYATSLIDHTSLLRFRSFLTDADAGFRDSAIIIIIYLRNNTTVHTRHHYSREEQDSKVYKHSQLYFKCSIK